MVARVTCTSLCRPQALSSRERFRARIAIWVVCASASVLAVTAASLVHAADVICVPNLAVDGTCTLSEPTIQDAINAASLGGGDTVLVGPGLYAESPTIDRSLTLRASAQASEVNAGNAAAQAIIDGSGVENTVTVSSGVDGVVIDGFEITNPTHSPAAVTSPAGILVQTDSAGGTTVTIDILNNVIHEVSDPARSSPFTTFGEAGILAFNIGAGSTISGNTLYDISDSEPPTGVGESPGSGRAQAILVKSSNGTASGTTVDGNILHDIQDVAIRFTGLGTASADVTNNSIDTIGSAGTGFLSGIGIDHFGPGAIAGNQISNVTGGFGLGIQATVTTSVTENVITGVAGGNISFPGGAILLNTGVVSVTDNFVAGNAIGITVVDPTGVTVNTNCIEGNLVGLINAAAGALDAKSNWWGDASGPSDGGSCGACPGTGDSIFNSAGGSTDFSSFASAPICELFCTQDRFVGTPGSDTNNDCLDSGSPCATIQRGVDLSCPDGTVNVAAGVYPEGPQIVIDKNVSVIGAGKAATVVEATGDTGSSGSSRGWWLVNPGAVFNLSDLTLDGAGFRIWQAIRHTGAGGTVENVLFTEIKFDESGPSYAGTGIAAFGSGPVDVTDCMFTGIGRIGVQFFGSGVSGSTLSGSTYTGKGDGDFLDYMIDGSAGAVFTLSGNTVTDNRGVASVDGSTSAGFLVSTFFGAGTDATIDGNVIEDNTVGIAAGFSTRDCPGPAARCDTSTVAATCNRISGNEEGIGVDVEDGATITINENSIAGNTEGVDADDPNFGVFSGTVDGKFNWWGSTTGPAGVGPGTGDPVTANVDFSMFETSVPLCVSCSTNDDCDDGLACNGQETCNTGTSMCEAGTAIVCSGECLTGACLEPTGECDPEPEATPCDTGDDTCSELDSCDSSGTCLNTGGSGDSDGDGICDADDNCSDDPNPGQEDLDNDGAGDVCDDDDGAGLSIKKVKVIVSTNSPGKDRWFATGELDVTLTPNFIDDVTADGLTIILSKQGGGGSLVEVNSFVFTGAQCSEKKGSIKCKDQTTKNQVRLSKRSALEFFKLKAKVRKQVISLPEIAETPLVVTLRTTGNVDRQDEIDGCTAKGAKKVDCRELP